MKKRSARQTANLLKLVDLLKHDPDPQNFSMQVYFHAPRFPKPDCGTPACVMGHYVASKGRPGDEQFAIDLHMTKDGRGEFGINNVEQGYIFGQYFYDPVADEHCKHDNDPVTAACRVLDVLYGGELA